MMIKYFMEEYLFQKFQHWMDILYIRFLKFLVVFTIGILPYHCVQAQQDFRCAVRLTFDSDNTGSVANYVLSLQLKNTKGRNVTGASILYKDSQGQVLGNTFLECLNSPAVSYTHLTLPTKRIV